ncbi:DUF6555 family protein [Pseudomonas zeae]|uniref:DUF6555 family protein n=1 Tax=Pseudomonas zeae TaxID=2745510 RepID=UPI0039DF64C1
MNSTDLYVIEYQLPAQTKSFVGLSPRLGNAEPRHRACCDSGLELICKPGTASMKMFSRLHIYATV